MSNPKDRISGLFFLLFGLFVFFYLIPYHVETVDYGSLRPKNLPQVLAIVIGLFGISLMIRPANSDDHQAAPWLKSGLVVLILACGLWLISWFGFVYVAPFIALALMLMMGERRIPWLLAGVVGIPAIIWFCVVFLLERPLP